MSMTELFGEVISCYTRVDALADGVIIDATETAKEAGVKHETAVTSNLYNTYIDPKPMPTGQDKSGRLWDVVWMFACCCKGSIGKVEGNRATFPVSFSGKIVTLNAVIEATSPDDPTPAITIMLPEDN